MYTVNVQVTGPKYVHGAIDMRTVNKGIEAQQSLRVHQFLLELYHSAAESLPHEHYMIKCSCIMIRYNIGFRGEGSFRVFWEFCVGRLMSLSARGRCVH